MKVGWTLHSWFLQLYRIIFHVIQKPVLDHFIMLVVLLDTGTLMAQTFQGVTVRASTVIYCPALIVTLSAHILSFGWDNILESWLVTLAYPMLQEKMKLYSINSVVLVWLEKLV